MRDFSWKYFALTGDVESFMLYKEVHQLGSVNNTDTLAGVDDELVLDLDDTTS